MHPFCFRAWLSLMAAFLLPLVAAGQGPIRLPDVHGTAGVRTIPIQVTGSLAAQAARLFDLHGAYQRVTGGADFTLQFAPAEGTGVALTILSGGRPLWQNTFQGPSQRDALYAAADAAVQRTAGIPGFFQSRIAFISTRTGQTEVYLSDILFEAPRQLTRDRALCLSPALSPDGRVLLYSSYHATGFPDIYRIDLATGQRTVFAGYRGTNVGATFSPDGQQVAMIMSGAGNAEVFVSNAQGRQLRRLTNTASLEADPAWSPDGRRLVFTSDQMGGPQLFVMDVQGRSMSRLRTDISRNCSEPHWNPVEPDLIAFTAATGGSFQIALFSFKEGRSRFLTQGPGDAVHPAWLRDGRHLVYTERTPRSSRLMVLDTVSGRRFPLSPPAFNSAREAAVVYPAR